MNTPITLYPKGFLYILLALFIGILITVFVALGISAFYPAPSSYPTYPQELYTAPPEKAVDSYTPSPAQQAYDEEVKQYESKRSNYDRIVSGVSMGIAVLILVLSITLLRAVSLIAEGVLLGGIGVLMYSIGLTMGTNSPKFQFLIVSIGLIITLALAYWKFARPINMASPAVQDKN